MFWRNKGLLCIATSYATMGTKQSFFLLVVHTRLINFVFKLMATTWKAINNQASKYIQQLLQRKPQLNHNLRSNSKLLLSESLFQNKNKFEDKSFSFVAPKLWNSLPYNVRNAITRDSFKKNWQTHSFIPNASKLLLSALMSKQSTGIEIIDISLSLITLMKHT